MKVLNRNNRGRFCGSLREGDSMTSEISQRKILWIITLDSFCLLAFSRADICRDLDPVWIFCICVWSRLLPRVPIHPWWRHQMETFFALTAICAGNSPKQRPVTRSFDVFFDLPSNKRLSKQSWERWFETTSCPLWRHRNVYLLHGRLCHVLCC